MNSLEKGKIVLTDFSDKEISLTRLRCLPDILKLNGLNF